MSTPPTNIAPSDPTPPTGPAAAPPAAERSLTFDSTLQLLAMCPLLAVSDTVVKAVGFSVVVLVLLPLATVSFGLVRRWLDVDISLPGSLLITGGLVTAAELFMRAWFPDLDESFGVFVPLLAVNIVVIDHIQTPTRERLAALARSVRLGLGIALTLVIMGFARELVGRGSLLNEAGALLGSWAERLEIKVFSVDMGFLLAMLPPGAFISLGLLIAARNWLAKRHTDDA